MKYCKNCGESVDENAKFCQSCGMALKQEVDNTIFKNNDSSYTAPTKAQNETTTLVLGIVGVSLAVLNYIGIPFVHLIAIVLGIIGLSLAKKDKDESKTYSKPGFILSIIALVLGVLSIILEIIFVNIYF